MNKLIFITLLFYVVFLPRKSSAQHVREPDSMYVKIYPKYDSVNNGHRKIFGENYRKEYSMETKLPVLYLSRINGGLKALQLGGGNQTRSLRLQDKQGQEWVLRKVEKYPEVLLPEELRQTFLKDVIKDNMSAQHPFSALVVPALSEAAGVAHSNPIIGWVAPDESLGPLFQDFAGTVCLLEEREPEGKSDNTEKAFRKMAQSNAFSVDAVNYLKLKCLDVLIGDWDRHIDQWRWRLDKNNQYLPIPKDRDQVFFRADGKIQRFTQSSWFLPMMQGYERDIKNINWFLWEGREINTRIFREMEEAQWDSVVNDFCSSMSDEVFSKALKALPEPAYSIHGPELMEQMKTRRASLPRLMNTYYHYFNRIVDIEFSDKHEKISVLDGGADRLLVQAFRLDVKGNQGTQIYKRLLDPSITREVRIYLRSGKDQLLVNAQFSPIRIRIIAQGGEKMYSFEQSKKRVVLYDSTSNNIKSIASNFRIAKHISKDSINTAYQAKDLYKRTFTYPFLGYNLDDGVGIGFGLKFLNPGFRKTPYGNSQTISAQYAFSTSAFKIGYTGEWIDVVGKADLILKVIVNAPNNTQNFFGIGNQTLYDDNQSITYYRARFSLYELSPALRWMDAKSKFILGPTFQYYTYDEDENAQRFIGSMGWNKGGDSLSLAQDKLFSGVNAQYTFSTRNSTILPSKGILLNLKASGMFGLNHDSKDFGQLNASFNIFQRLNPKATLVLSEKFGGGLTLGNPAFYQSQFLGGQGNLIGYRQFRFAGKHMFYNNLEIRARMGTILTHIVPGEIGLIGQYDTGRVWADGEKSTLWHHGYGAGLYYTPISMYAFRLIASRSREGWYPFFTMNISY